MKIPPKMNDMAHAGMIILGLQLSDSRLDCQVDHRDTSLNAGCLGFVSDRREGSCSLLCVTELVVGCQLSHGGDCDWHNLRQRASSGLFEYGQEPVEELKIDAEKFCKECFHGVILLVWKADVKRVKVKS